MYINNKKKFSTMYHRITFYMSNFNGHLLLPYKFPRPIDCMLPTTCLRYDIKYNKRSVYLRMYCHTIFRGNGVNKQATFANAKLVSVRLQIDSIKRGRSYICFT
jgi:hypothetical protein